MKNFTALTILVFISYTSYCQLFTESFENITALTGNGWSQINASTAIGTSGWFEGNNTVFKANSGTPKQYIAANFNNTTGNNTISNWLITPVIALNNGSTITFYTRTAIGSPFPDRLEVRLSEAGASSIAPTSDTDVGSYTNLILEINPTLVTGGFPEVWTLQTITVSGLSGLTDTRIAFRYYVIDGGPNGNNSNYIGIDDVNVSPTLGVNETLVKDLKYSFNKDTKLLSLESKSPLDKISVYSILGQELFTNELDGTYNTINLSMVKSGAYLVIVKGNSNNKVIKLIIN